MNRFFDIFSNKHVAFIIRRYYKNKRDEFKLHRHANMKTVSLIMCLFIYVIREADTKRELN